MEPSGDQDQDNVRERQTRNLRNLGKALQEGEYHRKRLPNLLHISGRKVSQSCREYVAKIAQSYFILLPKPPLGETLFPSLVIGLSRKPLKSDNDNICLHLWELWMLRPKYLFSMANKEARQHNSGLPARSVRKASKSPQAPDKSQNCVKISVQGLSLMGCGLQSEKLEFFT